MLESSGESSEGCGHEKPNDSPIVHIFRRIFRMFTVVDGGSKGEVQSGDCRWDEESWLWGA